MTGDTKSSWLNMLQRCNNPKCPKYDSYGGRGITIHPNWLVYANFLRDMGPRPDGTTLGRKDNNGNYTPDNCSWQTSQEQAWNKQNTIYITYNGKRQNLEQWSKELGIPLATLAIRRKRNPDDYTYILSPADARSPTIEYMGERLTLVQWGKKLGIQIGTLNKRIQKHGNNPEELFAPVRARGGW